MPLEEVDELSMEEDIMYYDLVKDNMIHVCSNAVNGCIDSIGNCRRGYRGRIQTESSTLDANGYPKYKRPTERDFNVVPHNRELLLDWEGHINVEYAGTSYTVLYLYKYLFKGNRKVKAIFQDITENISKNDESKLYIRGKFLCAMDAMWRISGYHTYPVAKPAVLKIKVKVPSHVEQLFSDGKLCGLAVYFARPSLLSAYLYTKFFTIFTYGWKVPARFRGNVWTEETLEGVDESQLDVERNFCIDRYLK